MPEEMTMEDTRRLAELHARPGLTSAENAEMQRLAARDAREPSPKMESVASVASPAPQSDADRLAELRAKPGRPSREMPPDTRTDAEEDEMAGLVAKETAEAQRRATIDYHRLGELRSQPSRTIDEEDEMRRLTRAEGLANAVKPAAVLAEEARARAVRQGAGMREPGDPNLDEEARARERRRLTRPDTRTEAEPGDPNLDGFQDEPRDTNYEAATRERQSRRTP